MKQNKIKNSFMLVVCVLVLGAVFSRQNAITAEAASEYRELFDFTAREAGTEIVKSGNYYFKSNQDGSISISKKKNSGYKKTPMMYNAFTNGKQAYYINKNVLYKYVYASQKATRLKKIKATGDQYYTISTIYGSQIFITMNSFDQWKLDTYSYNVKTGKWKKVMADCDIQTREGRYVIAQHEYRTDVSPYSVSLYKITANGLTKIKTLSKQSMGGKIINGNVYYDVYADEMMRKVSLYRCKTNGTKAKKLVTVSSSEQAGFVYFTEITEKYCKFSKDGKKYRYTYASKKMVELE